MSYTQNEIDDLIACRKKIVQPPRLQPRVDGLFKRNDMRVASDDGSREFSVFMRQNTDFPENFSIGLEFLPRDEDRFFC